MCRIRAILDRFDNGDQQQLDVIANDRTRVPELIARSLHVFDVDITGMDVRRHQLATCDCHGWVD